MDRKLLEPNLPEVGRGEDVTKKDAANHHVKHGRCERDPRSVNTQPHRAVTRTT